MELNFKDLADSLYTSFVARDFFAKVVPGPIVLAAVVVAPANSQFTLKSLNELPILGWLLLYGVCFLIGFAVHATRARAIFVQGWSHSRPLHGLFIWSGA